MKFLHLRSGFNTDKWGYPKSIKCFEYSHVLFEVGYFLHRRTRGRIYYQVGLTVEKRFTPACLDENIGSVRLFDGVDLADLEEDHVDKDGDLHTITNTRRSRTTQRSTLYSVVQFCSARLW